MGISHEVIEGNTNGGYVRLNHKTSKQYYAVCSIELLLYVVHFINNKPVLATACHRHFECWL